MATTFTFVQSGVPRSRRAMSLAPRAVRSAMLSVLMSVIAGSLAGCKDLAGTPALPAGVEDPSFFSTKSGAIGMRNTAVAALQLALPFYIVDAGVLTDELVAIPGTSNVLDVRMLPDGTSSAADNDYGNLQLIRSWTAQAIGALAAYDTAAADTAAARALRSELFAIDGYAELLLGDLFCSGVPLSTVDFNKDYTYAASSTTQQVDSAALAQLTTALALAGSDAQLQTLARVGQGRALVDLGRYAEAARAVQPVPTGSQYQLALGWADVNIGGNFLNHVATIADREGVNGLPFLSDGDPRTTDTLGDVTQTGQQLLFPQKYSRSLGSSNFAPFSLASGIEARLIEAEAELQAHGVASADTTWLHTLNTLRATVSLPWAPSAVLPPLRDPGSANNGSARVSLLFAERAAWLYLTGTRQGDLRRLIRQYHRQESQVYPTGPYTQSSVPGGRYGMDVTAPIPTSEDANQNFHGCLDRSA